MAMLIQDLVSLDVSGDFRSDVQLSDMGNPALNEDLLNSYIFTVHAPKTYGAQQRSLSSRDVLDTLKTIFTVEREENRVVLTANYGHGKSHLALVLANFFSHPSDSAEVKSVLERLSQALNNRSQLAGYRDFKRSKGEFLVVRLQGDQFTDLHEGFVRALEQALREHKVTRSVEIPSGIVRRKNGLQASLSRHVTKQMTFLGVITLMCRRLWQNYRAMATMK